MDEGPLELDDEGCRRLAAALSEDPESLMAIHLMRRGLARAVAVGEPARPRVVVVQPGALPEEPMALGDDAPAAWAALRVLDGWAYVNASAALAPKLAVVMREALGREPDRLGETYFALRRPVEPVPLPAVRRLNPADLPIVEPVAADLGNLAWRFGDAATMLREGIVAGAVIDGRLVSAAYSSALGVRFGEVGVATLPGWRGRGFGGAAAALVCAEMQRTGLTPVWSTAEDNRPSLRVAGRLGFAEVSRRVYLSRE